MGRRRGLLGVSVTSAGEPVPVMGSQSATEPHRVYLELGEPLRVGDRVVETSDGSFVRTVVAGWAEIAPEPTHDISPWIYGVAHAPDPGFLETHGVSVARWGGNTSSLYNPLGHHANTGNDWYFENFVLGSAEQWLGWMDQGGARTFLSVPALDWVARDGTSYSYSVDRYGAQEEVDPFRPDAGNGILENGTPITWNDPSDAATPWSPDDAAGWLAGLAVAPGIASVDNELDIASQTHGDVHPEPMTYDELLDRFLGTARTIRDELPGTEVAGLSSCCWWYYWNSAAGDKPQHGGDDFLPWFLDRAADEEAITGERLLDILDVHYYPEADVFNDRMDPETSARRLRSTRSLWDPSYTDEGWIGEDHDATADQPSPNQVQLIPRLRQLIDDHYPGTGLGITEWNFGADGHLSGGLATADALGIFGREGLYLATFWECPQEGTYESRQFGGSLQGTVVVHPEMSTDGSLLVPAYSALFLVAGEVDPPADDDDDSVGDDDTAGDDDEVDDDRAAGGGDCDCRVAGEPPTSRAAALAVSAVMILVSRRRHQLRR